MTNLVTMEPGNFSSIPNSLLNNSKISLTAKGLYVFMRGKPAAWNFTIRSMAKQLKEGETAITTALNELKETGWLSYTKRSDGRGVYHLFWTAKPERKSDKPEPENPVMAKPKQEKPNQGFPMKGKPQRISKKEPIVRKINKEPIVCNESHTTDSTEDAFEAFWLAGMRKVNKKRALSLFAGICKRKKLDPVQFANQLAEDVRKRVSANQMGFDRMHPTTYLSNERWNDEVVCDSSQSLSARHGDGANSSDIDDISWASNAGLSL